MSVLAPTDARSQSVRTDLRPDRRLAGWLALVQGLLIFVPVVVLGRAIGWPASLGSPASVVLPALLEHAAPVRLGYLVYLAYSLLFGFTVLALLRLVDDRLSPTGRSLVVGFAIASVAARAVGIVRWLSPMPALAQTYAQAGPDARPAVEVAYATLNDFGGTIGEALGVGIFAAVALAGLGVGLLRAHAPRALAVGALVSALALLASAVDLVGVDLSPVLTLSVTVVQVWFLAVGLWLLLTARRRP